ncbi:MULTISPECIES: hypothetical protein [unclassified Hahella]|uniref:hypothetical protein n=1 Tax=unclassified Hahella TaxID=2624107 RepID=UPI000FDF29A5|nr:MULTISPECIES: hypothetical protein [unclassified Hahella]AZZ89697.1 hypothetical protein ENC22_00285 [Hahella sp. KA22]MBU6950228.1 hypothetical protein [Hahella sp. HN01]MDG9666439.1 hypothetical protein [Hahella sp. CR1]QAY53067.1 hypothetical protein EUZ85_02830 [Hahella sp. KA22]
MNTLEAQRCRLQEELALAEKELEELLRTPNPNKTMVNFYSDLLVRNRELIRMIDTHLSQSSHWITDRANSIAKLADGVA